MLVHMKEFGYVGSRYEKAVVPRDAERRDAFCGVNGTAGKPQRPSHGVVRSITRTQSSSPPYASGRKALRGTGLNSVHSE